MRQIMMSGLFAVGLALGVSATAPATPYIFTPIDFPGAVTTEAWGITDRGAVVPSTIVGFANSQFGFLRDSSGNFTAFQFGAAPTLAFGINSIGQAVGAQFGGPTGGFLFDKGLFTSIDFPGGSDTHAQGINVSGQIVGYYFAGGSPHAFFRDQQGNFSTVDPPGSSAAKAFGVGFLPLILGTYFPGGHGFVFDGVKFITVDFPNSTSTELHGITANDETIVGSYFKGGINTTNENGLVLTGLFSGGGVFSTLNFPGSTDTELNGINDDGQIVGTYNDAQHGFVATPIDAIIRSSVLDCLLNPGICRMQLVTGLHFETIDCAAPSGLCDSLLEDLRLLTGPTPPSVDSLIGESVAFVPEPNALFLLGSGLVGVGGMAWRRSRRK